ncbi:MAG: sigma-70 family RNA polymerase sigma factor [Clostridia bacterium]|nr:sigma-70 family RNA polymerase sigma factor [Clostridia bacterium]
MTDEAIVEMLLERSEESISEIEKKYGKSLRKIAFDILGNENDAEECVNDAYFTVWNASQAQAPESLFGFLCKILRNISFKRFRANNAQMRRSNYSEALEEFEQTFAAEESVETEIDKKYFSEVMDEFLLSLPKQSRVAFVRRYWFSESCRDIAKMLGTSENNVAVRLKRAREKLRKFLEERGIDL